MSEHHNFDHADADFIPQGGNGRTLRLHYTGRDWCGVVLEEALPGGGYANIYHIPARNGLPTAALKAAGWVLSFD